MNTSRVFGLLALLAAFGLAGSLLAADEKREDGKKEQSLEERRITLAEGKFVLIAPEPWIRKEPKVRFIEHEFEVPAAGNGEEEEASVDQPEAAGRVTVMGAGGSVEANIKRWLAQFVQPDGSDTEEAAKVEETEVADQKVHLVDVSGTYLDKPPFAAGRAIEREDYRMLAAIIETKAGNYFVKFYGPAPIVAENEEAFQEMIEGLEQK